MGYAFRYAGKIENPDRSQRIVLITDRRLGAVNRLWNPAYQGDPNDYEFSVIELRLNGKGEGEGKASLTGKIAPDAAAKIVTLENYDALAPVFRERAQRDKTIGRIRSMRLKLCFALAFLISSSAAAAVKSEVADAAQREDKAGRARPARTARRCERPADRRYDGAALGRSGGRSGAGGSLD